jgi:hypothetical protein
VTGFAPRFTITHAITAGLTAIERARGFLEAAALSEEWVRRMSQRALLLEAHHTTHIEGTLLTIEESERLWAGEDVPGAKPDDVRIAGAARAATRRPRGPLPRRDSADASARPERAGRARCGEVRRSCQGNEVSIEDQGLVMDRDTIATSIATKLRHESRHGAESP